MKSEELLYSSWSRCLCGAWDAADLHSCRSAAAASREPRGSYGGINIWLGGHVGAHVNLTESCDGPSDLHRVSVLSARAGPAVTWPLVQAVTPPPSPEHKLTQTRASLHSEKRWRGVSALLRQGFVSFSSVLARSPTLERLRASSRSRSDSTDSRCIRWNHSAALPGEQKAGRRRRGTLSKRDVEQLLDRRQLPERRDGMDRGPLKDVALGSAGLQASIVLNSSAPTRQLGGNCFLSLRHH